MYLLYCFYACLAGLVSAQIGGAHALAPSSATAQPATITSAPSATEKHSTCSESTSNCYYSYTTCFGKFGFYSNCYAPCVTSTAFTCETTSTKATIATPFVVQD
ncbi:uncharacterized protein JN550_007436 [Neoarthrinium moseri]|uniref:uncharacterized protein n=1 Tax=Neoarthrinium moseri TaxID=1658444 RepID=UPI001FDB59FC|nr:uncharacterized protein JN550_007436 [Neoarthrinium moseri]KAI1866889.1 hypothetical protein JN550_007436 [Neoarthrinium moseri]